MSVGPLPYTVAYDGAQCSSEDVPINDFLAVEGCFQARYEPHSIAHAQGCCPVEFAAVVDVDCFVTYSASVDSFGHTYISMLWQLAVDLKSSRNCAEAHRRAHHHRGGYPLRKRWHQDFLPLT